MVDLLQKFVCVRVIQGNGADLSLFQFDYDATFAAFFMNADKTIYGRFGSAHEGAEHVTRGALLEAMHGALRMHEQHGDDAEMFANKRGQQAVAATPLGLRALGRFGDEVDFENGGGAVDGSCIHCHQLGTGLATERWAQNKPLTDKVLFPWPMPDRVGMRVTVDDDTLIDDVVAGSAAEKAGLRRGDRILTFDAQPLLSLADIQWVLHQTEGAAKLPIVVQRDFERIEATLELGARWRRPQERGRRMRGGHASLARVPGIVMGSVQLAAIDAARRAELGIKQGSMALESRAGRGGRRGRFGRGRRGGGGGSAKPPTFERGDVIVSFDGIETAMSDIDVMAHLFQRHKAGDEVPLVVLRNGERVELSWRL